MTMDIMVITVKLTWKKQDNNFKLFILFFENTFNLQRLMSFLI